MVSEAQFQKKLNGRTRFCQDGPNFVYFSIDDQDFLPQDQQLKITQNWLCLDKIWFGHSISFEILLKKPQLECQNVRGLRLEISVLAATQRQSFSTVRGHSPLHQPGKRSLNLLS